MTTIAKSEAERRAEDLAGHVLTLLAANPDAHLYVYRFARPGDSNHANTIIFDRHGIVIHGDTCFGGHDQGMAVSGARGKGPGWFAGDLSEDYLAGKFLYRNKWSADKAEKRLRYEADALAEDENPDDISIVASLRSLADQLRDGDYEMEHELYEELCERRLEGCFEGCPGYGYDENALGWLVAIQRRFAALWKSTEGAA